MSNIMIVAINSRDGRIITAKNARAMAIEVWGTTVGEWNFYFRRNIEPSSDLSVVEAQFENVVCENVSPKKPPLGITPRKIREEHRTEEILAAIRRYVTASLSVPDEWFNELSELARRRGVNELSELARRRGEQT